MSGSPTHISADAATQIVREHFDPRLRVVAVRCIHTGPVNVVYEWRTDGHASELIAKICPKGVGSVRDLISTNPYDVKGRCFEFFGQKLQILSRSIGLYSLSPELVYYIDFGSNSAPANYYRGYVKGVGAFQYETVSGAVKTVPSFVPIRLPDQVPANLAD